jgi:hypothetical protein
MKQMSQVRKPDTTLAIPARDRPVQLTDEEIAAVAGGDGGSQSPPPDVRPG